MKKLLLLAVLFYSCSDGTPVKPKSIKRTNAQDTTVKRDTLIKRDTVVVQKKYKPKHKEQMQFILDEMLNNLIASLPQGLDRTSLSDSYKSLYNVETTTDSIRITMDSYITDFNKKMADLLEIDSLIVKYK